MARRQAVNLLIVVRVHAPEPPVREGQIAGIGHCHTGTHGGVTQGSECRPVKPEVASSILVVTAEGRQAGAFGAGYSRGGLP